MKTWISMLIIFLSVATLCVVDGIHTTRVFNKLHNEAESIYEQLLVEEVSKGDLSQKIWDLNSYWTEEMDSMCISISRKDLQVISDYLQYLCASTINESQEDAITYSRLLHYNLVGLKQSNGLSLLNLL